MDYNKAKKIHYLFFTFMGLFHEKFYYRFKQDTPSESFLKKNHKKIMNILYQYDQITLTEIGKLLDIEKGSLTTLIDYLEENHLISRLNDPKDRRKNLISLSNKGKEEMERVMNYFAHKIDESLHQFDSSEIQEFEKSLNFVVEFMKKV
jgi:MarR family transcriptional regulator, organic hydroperoxide resistance regulator